VLVFRVYLYLYLLVEIPFGGGRRTVDLFAFARRRMYYLSITSHL
jgi:hypothetical protein